VVLALAAAVVVPMLLESDPRPLGEDVAVRIPPVDDGKFVNRLTDKGRIEPPGASAKGDTVNEPQKSEAASPMAGKDGSAREVAVKDPPAKDAVATANASAAKNVLADAERKMLNSAAKSAPASAPMPKTASAAPAAPPSANAPAASPPATAPAAPPPAAAPAAAKADDKPAFSVQLAAFADDKGANALSNKLRKAGYPAYTEPLTTSKGTLWRVRVGPFASRDAASSSRDKLKGDGYSGIVAHAN
jgi:DedD protein